MKKLTCTIFTLFSFLSAMPGFSRVDDGFPLPFLEQWNYRTVEVPADGLVQGLYLVRVETGGAILAKKVVVRR